MTSNWHPEAQPRRSGLRASMAKLLSDSLDLIFPPRCANCGRVDATWCNHCAQALAVHPLDVHSSDVPPLAGIISTGVHEGLLRAAIHVLKYENLPHLAGPLGNRLAAVASGQPWDIDLVIPVPLHFSRLALRGYNQANLIAGELAVISGLPCAPQALQRARDTRVQVGLSRQERRDNVAGAFTADAALVGGQNLLVVDDVYTTGATLAACAQAALDAGAQSVYALTVTTARPDLVL